MKRRELLHAMAATMLAGAARADIGGGPLTLLVAGPDGAQTSRWGNASALALAPGFPGAPQILTQAQGGLDGVTGGNQLDALVIPDGKTAAILPGASLIAWLTGDSRVHFDPTRWVPIMSGGASGVLVMRAQPGAGPNLAGLRAAAPLRLAADQPQSSDLAALLALARLGVQTAPVFGLRGIDAKTKAFAAGEVDAVFVSGENVPADVGALGASGAVPVFCLGVQQADGSVAADPLFPGLPDVIAFNGNAAPFLDGAYQAAAAAVRLDFLMVLPKLTDPDAVALWRMAADAAIATPALTAAASASAITLQSATILSAGLSALNGGATDQPDLQAYLAKSFGWQPG